jgi:hypothetical protein
MQHDKARSASDRPATRDAQHPESGVLNSYHHILVMAKDEIVKERSVNL